MAGFLVIMLLGVPLAHGRLRSGARRAEDPPAIALPWPQVALIALLHWMLAILLAATATLWLGLFTRIGFLAAFVAGHLALSPLARGCLSGLGQVGARAPSTRWERLAAAAGVSLAALPVLAASSRLVALPMAPDALAYHLPMAAQWVQTGSMLTADARVWFYPGNYELLTSVFFLLAGHDGLWFAPDLIAWATLFLALWSLLSTCGVPPVAAPVHAAAAMWMPLVQRCLGVGDNDLFAAAIFLSAVWLIVAARLSQERRSVLGLAVLVIAVLVGTKLALVAYAALLGALVLWASRGLTDRTGRPRLAAIAAVALLLAGSFYARNAILTGNPVYPVGVAPFGITLLPWGDTSHVVAIRRAISPAELAATTLARTRLPGETARLLGRHLWGLATSAVLLLGAGALWTLWRRRPGAGKAADRHIPSGTAWLLAVVLGVSFVAFLNTPLALENLPGTSNQLIAGWSLRFALPSVVLAFALGALLLPSSSAPFVPWLAVAASASASPLPRAEPIAVSLAVFAVLLATFRLRERWSRAAPRRSDLTHLRAWALFAAVLLVAGLLLQGFLRATSEGRSHQTAAGYTYGVNSRVVEWVNANVPDGAVMASLTSLRAYPLIGHRFQRRVISVGLSLPAEAWVRAVQQHRAEYLVLSREAGDGRSPTYGQFPPEDERFRALAGPGWSVVFEDGFARVYRQAR